MAHAGKVVSAQGTRLQLMLWHLVPQGWKPNHLTLALWEGGPAKMEPSRSSARHFAPKSQNRRIISFGKDS